MKEHLGGIYDFLQARKLESFRELEQQKSVIHKESVSKVATDNKLSFEEYKELNRKIRKSEQQVETAEKNISKYEKEIEEMTEKMNNPQFASDESLFADFKVVQDKLEKELSLWEEYNMELEELQAQKND